MIAAILVYWNTFMSQGSEYQISIAIMCRDFLSEMDEIPGFSHENDYLFGIIEAIIEEGDEDLFHLRNLEAHLAKYESKLLLLYSRNPDDSYLDRLYRRSASLKEMCSALTK